MPPYSATATTCRAATTTTIRLVSARHTQWCQPLKVRSPMVESSIKAWPSSFSIVYPRQLPGHEQADYLLFRCAWWSSSWSGEARLKAAGSLVAWDPRCGCEPAAGELLPHKRRQWLGQRASTTGNVATSRWEVVTGSGMEACDGVGGLQLCSPMANGQMRPEVGCEGR